MMRAASDDCERWLWLCLSIPPPSSSSSMASPQAASVSQPLPFNLGPPFTVLPPLPLDLTADEAASSSCWEPPIETVMQDSTYKDGRGHLDYSLVSEDGACAEHPVAVMKRSCTRPQQVRIPVQA